MPILLDKLAWKSTFIKFTICQRIKLSISWFCCLEMLSEFKIISTAFLWLTSTKTQLYRSLLKAIGRVLLVTAIMFAWGGCFQQGPKLTFLGRRQVATETFFSVAIWKNVVAIKSRKKVSIKFFLRTETQTKIFGCQMENSGRQFFF